MIEVMTILAILAILALVVFAPVYSCSGRWADSGMRAEWRWLGLACMVQRKDGTWVPEKAIRDVSL